MLPLLIEEENAISIVTTHLKKIPREGASVIDFAVDMCIIQKKVNKNPSIALFVKFALAILGNYENIE